MPGSPTLELRHLRYFVAVAEARSFVGAADKLHIAQPALSRQIHDLEHLIGTDLFVRDARGTLLTPAGHACHIGAQRILRDVDAALERARLAAQGLVGRCVIGATKALIWNGIVARLIERARRDFPRIDIAVEELSLESAFDALTACTIDLALSTAPPRRYTQLSYEMHMVDVVDAVVLSKQHRFAQRPSLRLEELQDEPFVCRVGAESQAAAKREFERRGFVPRSEIGVEALDSVLVLICAGAGWTVVPRSLRQFAAQHTAVVPIEDFAVPAGFSRLWRRGESRPVIRTILSLMRRMTEESHLDGHAAPNDVDACTDTVPMCSAARLELRHLRYFTAIVNEGSIGRAAERLGLTQPAISRQVRDLESVVGVALIDRVSRGVSPTMAGQALHEDAMRILGAAEGLPGEAQRVVRAANGRCVIGMIPTPILHDIVTRAVREATIRMPEIALTVVDVPTPMQPDALASARIDLGLGHSYPTFHLDRSIVQSRLADDALNTALLAATSPLAKRESLTLANLADIPFLFMKRSFSPAFYDQVMGAFARVGYRPRIDVEYDGLPTVWALAAKNIGWCLASQSQRKQPPPGLVAVPLRDFELPWGAHLVCREDEFSQAILAIRDLLLQTAASTPGEA